MEQRDVTSSGFNKDRYIAKRVGERMESVRSAFEIRKLQRKTSLVPADKYGYRVILQSPLTREELSRALDQCVNPYSSNGLSIEQIIDNSVRGNILSYYGMNLATDSPHAVSNIAWIAMGERIQYAPFPDPMGKGKGLYLVRTISSDYREMDERVAFANTPDTLKIMLGELPFAA